MFRCSCSVLEDNLKGPRNGGLFFYLISVIVFCAWLSSFSVLLCISFIIGLCVLFAALFSLWIAFVSASCMVPTVQSIRTGMLFSM